MTFKELKNLIAEYKLLKSSIEYINKDNDLSKNEQLKQIKPIETKIKRIEEKTKKYAPLFEVRGDSIQEALKQALQNADIWHNCKINKHEQDGFYGPSVYYTGFAWIDISCKQNNKETIINILKRPVNKDLNNSLKYYLGDYKINIFEELLNNNYPKEYSKQINDALWQVAKEKLLQHNVITLQLNNSKKTLLMKKLMILKDEELRKKEIEKLTNEINILKEENNVLINEPENATIDELIKT